MYVITKGTMTFNDGSGWYGPGDVRWVRANTMYGPEEAGPEGCEFVHVSPGPIGRPVGERRGPRQADLRGLGERRFGWAIGVADITATQRPAERTRRSWGGRRADDGPHA